MRSPPPRYPPRLCSHELDTILSNTVPLVWAESLWIAGKRWPKVAGFFANQASTSDFLSGSCFWPSAVGRALRRTTGPPVGRPTAQRQGRTLDESRPCVARGNLATPTCSSEPHSALTTETARRGASTSCFGRRSRDCPGPWHVWCRISANTSVTRFPLGPPLPLDATNRFADPSAEWAY